MARSMNYDEEHRALGSLFTIARRNFASSLGLSWRPGVDLLWSVSFGVWKLELLRCLRVSRTEVELTTSNSSIFFQNIFLKRRKESMRILLAEDDQNISVITQLCLEKIGGHTVTVATDGEKAIQCAKSGEFDLFILDGMMPKFSGFQVAEEIRKTNTETPIIFLSARSEPKEVDVFLKVGAGFIPKPFDPQKICQHIDSILKQRKAV